MRILLTGAQGFLGRHLLAALHGRGHQVVACARQIPKESKRTSVQWQQVEFGKHRSAKAWLPYLQDIDVVINTVGIIRECGGQSFKVIHEQAPKALFDACEQAGVGRLVHVSALAIAAAEPLPKQYWRDARCWFYLGIPAFSAMVAIYALMMFKPSWT